jgi:P4 family phage/plasmid primase-like protien
MIELLAHRYENGTLRVRSLQQIAPDYLRTETHLEMFQKHHDILGSLPEDQRYNLHYKLSNNDEQDLIPIDIDKIEGIRELYAKDKEDFTKLCLKYTNVVAKHFQLDPKKLGVVFSGNGLHILIQTDFIFHGKDIREMRDNLKDSIAELNYAFSNEDLKGFVDLQPFRDGGTLRFPGSLNIKGEIESPTELLQIPQVQQFEMSKLQKAPDIKGFIPDTAAVLKGCDFLNYTRVNAKTISRKQWHLMVGILRHLENGDTMVHSYSSLDDVRYSEKETNKYIADWEKIGGPPPLCSTVEKEYSKCKNCPHRKKDTTALMIRDESSKLIDAKVNGFREIIVTKNGTKKGRFLYKELVEYFIQRNGDFLVAEPNGYIYQYNGKNYIQVTTKKLQSFAYEHMDEATSREAEEFAKQMRLMSGKQKEFEELQATIIGKVNFNNGIFHSDTGEFTEHDPKYFFQTTLPSNYTKEAKCPIFDKFLDDIVSSDEEVKKVLLEFFGMTLANAPSRKVCKALFMTGEGSTGKSTFLNIMKHVLGKNSVSAVNIESLNNENHISGMVGKSANIVFEMSPNELRRSEKNFKAIVSGDAVFTRQLYTDGSDFEFNTKLIVACNALPPVDDSSNGVFRRMLIVPLKNVFSDELGNIDRDIADKILDSEIPGIVNLLLSHWKEFKHNKYRFSDSKEMNNKLKIVKEMNAIVNFSSEYLTMSKFDRKGTKVKMLYTHYVNYCRENGRSPKNKAQFLGEVVTQIVSTLHVPEREIIFKNNSGVQCVRFIQTIDPDYDPEEERL